MKPPAKKWLRTSEAARELGVSRSTVVRLCDAGVLVCRVLPSGHRRVRAASVARLQFRSEARSVG